jgi:hypothetical protein
MPHAPSKKQQHREKLVITFLRACGEDIERAKVFDRLVCAALGLDAEKSPPEFLADAWLLG